MCGHVVRCEMCDVRSRGDMCGATCGVRGSPVVMHRRDKQYFPWVTWPGASSTLPRVYPGTYWCVGTLVPPPLTARASHRPFVPLQQGISMLIRGSYVDSCSLIRSCAGGGMAAGRCSVCSLYECVCIGYIGLFYGRHHCVSAKLQYTRLSNVGRGLCPGTCCIVMFVRVHERLVY